MGPTGRRRYRAVCWLGAVDGGHVQVGGEDGMVLPGWVTVMGALMLGLGAAGFLASYDANDRVVWRRAAVPLVLMAGAGVMLIALGQTPAELCGSATEALGSSCP